MDLATIGTYLAANAAAAFSGIIFWWTVENFQPLQREKKRPEKLPLVITLGILLTPFGALFVSMLMKSRRIIHDIKQAEKEP